jgi:hypothetical protein
MKCVTDPGVGQAVMLVDAVEKDWNETGLPIMAMNNIGMLVGLEQEFKGGPGEKCEAFRIIAIAVKPISVEKMFVRVGLDKKALQSLCKAEVNVTMNFLIIIRYP